MGYSERYKKLISEGVVNSKYVNKPNRRKGIIKKEDTSDEYMGDKQLYNELPNNSEKEYRKSTPEHKEAIDDYYKKYKKLEPDLEYDDTEEANKLLIKYGKFRKA